MGLGVFNQANGTRLREQIMNKAAETPCFSPLFIICSRCLVPSAVRVVTEHIFVYNKCLL